MSYFASATAESSSSRGSSLPAVLGNPLVLDLDAFPELHWLSTYLTLLNSLHQDRDRLTEAIQAIVGEGEVYRDQWIETYTKSKNGKQYLYYQLRWLTGEYKPSGQPKVKTKHLSHRVVGEVRTAIARGHQVAALEQQRQAVEAEITRLQQLVRGAGRRLQRAASQHSQQIG
ncbi:hypothetical protein [Trichocoleus sp. FACHB-262]|uniref:hypothetical protein n=1 Tax=Trichocoleus sp. FACHB-262 TaxID=2692869 RepID=UPI001686F642|nr:hypothetical protein [Trichocoleus sp. FACHB-262]MBD2119308.1 hypothetical protein [Trichocoleus sp. FACHB-262]